MDSSLSKICIEEKLTVIEAMRILDKNGNKILFVQNHGVLLAALTDGDIRRWLMRGGDLQAEVRHVANYHPISLQEEQRHLAMSMMREQDLEALPILDERHVIQEILFQNNVKPAHPKFEDAIPVVMMAGGLGARLSPYTNILPKPLIPIGDYPIAEHIINRFHAYGCDQFYMIVNYKRNMIKAYFDELEKGYRLDFIEEDRPLGTGGGLSLLKGLVKSTFLLTNCDIVIDDDLTKAYKRHKESGNEITMVCSLKEFTIPYGVVKIGQDGEVVSMEEKPSMSFFTNTGCYFVEPEVVESLAENESIGFPEVIERCMASGGRVGVYPIGEEAWLDMGQLDELERMKARLERG